jgi:hypothetical protein
MPGLVCAYRLRFFPGSPLAGVAGLGSLSSAALRFLGSEGKVCQNFCKDYQVRLIG